MSADIAGFDGARVGAWLAEQGVGSGIDAVRPLGGGTQNVMVHLTSGDEEYVLRRGPVHLRRWSNTAILRETRVLAALSGTPVPHPALVAVCADPTVLGDAVFYLMRPVEGFNAGLELPDPHRRDAGVRHAMGLAMVDALAALGSVDHLAVGLADFGNPEGFLERQVGRWLDELASFSAYDGYPGPVIGDVDGVAGWLETHRPTRWTPGIMHGDYHASNVLFSRSGPDVTAIVDWEMCTIGDPLLDLGWMLATWELPGSPRELGGELARAGGLATPAELVERYAAQSRRDLSQMRWYTVLACFKLGILLEGSHARMYAGQAPAEIGTALHRTTVQLFERAQDLIERTDGTL